MVRSRRVWGFWEVIVSFSLCLNRFCFLFSVTSYDHMASIATVTAGRSSVAVDVAILLDADEDLHLLQTGALLFVFGTVEVVSGMPMAQRGPRYNQIALSTVDSAQLPTLLSLQRDNKTVIAAARVADAHGTDRDLWERAARQLSQTLHQRASQQAS